MQDTLEIDKPHVEDRVKEWEIRISNLYNTIKTWLEDSEYTFQLGPKLTMYEELMAQFDIPPIELDTADILKNNKIVLTIKPKGLWMIGTNGRIDILTSNGVYILIDYAEAFDTPKWKLLNRNNKIVSNFNKQVFHQLLK